MARLSKVPGSKAVMRGFDAVFGGFTVGEQAWRGNAWRAAGIAVTLMVPLLWKKRLGALALAALAALISYYFAEEMHEREIVTTEIKAPAHPSLN